MTAHQDLTTRNVSLYGRPSACRPIG